MSNQLRYTPEFKSEADKLVLEQKLSQTVAPEMKLNRLIMATLTDPK